MIQRITSLQPLRLANGPVRPKSALWRRPQCPGIGTHSRAFPNFPWQFTLENCQSATGVTAIINRQALRIATYSLETLCYGTLQTATEKLFSVVQKLWTTRLPCGSLRKTVDEIPNGTNEALGACIENGAASGRAVKRREINRASASEGAVSQQRCFCSGFSPFRRKFLRASLDIINVSRLGVRVSTEQMPRLAILLVLRPSRLREER